MKKILLDYGVYILLGLALLYVVTQLFDVTERIIQKRFGKFFDPSYFLNEIQDMYKVDISTYTTKGATKTEVTGYIISKYFDRADILKKAEDIWNAKGTFSDDENSALAVFSSLSSLSELSYLAQVFKTMQVPSAMTAKGLITTVILSGAVVEMEPAGDLLSYVLSFFNEKHREALIVILKKKPKKLKYKIISPPKDLDNNSEAPKEGAEGEYIKKLKPKGAGKTGGKAGKVGKP